MDAQHQVTQLLGQLNQGRQDALDKLMPLVYDELRRIAARHLFHERAGHTLQPTALVHEAFLRMVGQQDSHWEGRAHFLSVAAAMMRRVLIDHAKARIRSKRGGPGQVQVDFESVRIGADGHLVEVIAIDEALRKLEAMDPAQAKIVEMRFFGGASVEETAEAMKLSTATVKRYSNSARAWLQREIAPGAAG